MGDRLGTLGAVGISLFLEYFENHKTCDFGVIFGNFWAISMGAGAPAFSPMIETF